MPTQLIVNVGGSALAADIDHLQPWRALLDTADSIAILRDGTERIRVDLSGQRRWIAFNRTLNGCPLNCIGWQETVGATRYADGTVIGGSNRKVLAWVFPSGLVYWGERPEEI